MREKLIIGILLLFIGFILNSCEEPGANKPRFSGSFGELIVVAPNSIWKSDLGDSIYNIIGAYQYGLPQAERQFNIVHITPQKFKSVLKGHRNVCIIKVDTATVRPIKLEKSKWARGQLVITISAKSKKRLLAAVKENGLRAVELFQSSEINRHYLRNKKLGNAAIGGQIEKIQGFNMTTQKDAHLEKNKNGLTWIRLERERDKGGFRHQISQGTLLFSLPYTSQENFEDTNVYRTVDSVLKANLPGPGENQYIQLNFRYITPQATELNFKGSYAKEYRGLWRMENNAMGGPIYLLTFLNEKENRIIYAFGYVFAPQFNKREYLREVEGVIKSISIPEK